MDPRNNATRQPYPANAAGPRPYQQMGATGAARPYPMNGQPAPMPRPGQPGPRQPYPQGVPPYQMGARPQTTSRMAPQPRQPYPMNGQPAPMPHPGQPGPMPRPGQPAPRQPYPQGVPPYQMGTRPQASRMAPQPRQPYPMNGQPGPMPRPGQPGPMPRPGQPAPRQPQPAPQPSQSDDQQTPRPLQLPGARSRRPQKHVPLPSQLPDEPEETNEPDERKDEQEMPKKEKVFNVKKIIITVLVVVLLAGAAAVGITFLLNNAQNNSEQKPSDSEQPAVEPEPEITTPEKIDLQLTVDQWLVTQASKDNSGIVIFDIDNNEVVARHNEDKKIYIASIYKMFVAYEGYYRIDRGLWNGEDTYAIGKDIDGNQFTKSKCLDYMIRYSYSPCAETMWSEIGHDKLQSIYNEKGFLNTNISGIESTPSDLVKLYKLFYRHTDLSEESWEKIQDSMLNQEAPKTASSAYTQNWRQGFPSGFSTAKVYNKVGWLGDGGGTWNYYADAAFVNFPETVDRDTGAKRPERHYIMIVLTQKTNPANLVQLGRKIEETIKTADNYL